MRDLYHLWLFLPALLSSADPENLQNGALEPVTPLSFPEEADTVNDSECEPDVDEPCIHIFCKDHGGRMTNHIFYPEFMEENFELLEGTFCPAAGLGGFRLKNVACILTTELGCTWDTVNSPADAEYSVTIFQESKTSTICDCDRKDGRVIGCHGGIDSEKMVTLHINVSCENFWYIHVQLYNPKFIVKLSPPQNILASVESGGLQIKWDPPVNIPDECFHYQLRINEEDEPFTFDGERSFNLPNIDETRQYFIEMRVTKTKSCRKNNIWSDWSNVTVVPPHKQMLSPGVIISIALGIPMFLLAVILVCRCHSKIDKLFPVPSPSMKVKQLLEKDNFIQVLPEKHIEDNTEVLFVGSEE
ncbi:hypothetical protein GJAV_G00209670 [Gymnothorax javanicus]|nr:hypothetical protein GJAV_G00209670 [Gymnothorax javanicus]